MGDEVFGPNFSSAWLISGCSFGTPDLRLVRTLETLRSPCVSRETAYTGPLEKAQGALGPKGEHRDFGPLLALKDQCCSRQAGLLPKCCPSPPPVTETLQVAASVSVTSLRLPNKSARLTTRQTDKLYFCAETHTSALA